MRREGGFFKIGVFTKRFFADNPATVVAPPAGLSHRLAGAGGEKPFEATLFVPTPPGSVIPARQISLPVKHIENE